MEGYIEPARARSAFNCPNCRVYCQQEWYYLKGSSNENGFGVIFEDNRFTLSRCVHCDFPTIWHGDKMVYPQSTAAEPPCADLPDDMRRDYGEAQNIVDLSPRGASALLRLVIQKLCKHLGESGKNINDDIKSLVKKGLPYKVQEALDSVRVIGNDAVHPGEMDLRDDRETALALFRLVNFICRKMISEPAEVESIYTSLPAEKIDGIKKRDGKS